MSECRVGDPVWGVGEPGNSCCAVFGGCWESPVLLSLSWASRRCCCPSSWCLWAGPEELSSQGWVRDFCLLFYQVLDSCGCLSPLDRKQTIYILLSSQLDFTFLQLLSSLSAIFWIYSLIYWSWNDAIILFNIELLVLFDQIIQFAIIQNNKTENLVILRSSHQQVPGYFSAWWINWLAVNTSINWLIISVHMKGRVLRLRKSSLL